jgi:hypothetical protein
MAPHLDAVAELGFEFVRANLNWELIQPGPPAGSADAGFDWRSTDPWVAALAERGLRWQPTVMGTPTPAWARDPSASAAGCGYRSPPGRPFDYARFAGALAARYGREGGFWRMHPELPYEPITAYQLWNEPNHHPFWCPRPDPEAWAALAGAAARALHAVDPEASVVSAGLAGFPRSVGTPPHTVAADEFLRRALAAEPELARVIDVVGVHLYGRTPADVAHRLAWFRSVVDATPLRGGPLSVTEFGWATSGARASVASERARTAYVAALTPLIARSSCGVEALALHTWRSAEIEPANAGDWYGVADPASAEPYPTALAYASAAAELTGSDRPAAGSESLKEQFPSEDLDPCAE